MGDICGVFVNEIVSWKGANGFIILVWGMDDSGKVLGQSNLRIETTLHKRAEIGLVTHQDVQRQGLAFEASRAMIDYAFENFDLRRIVANIDTRQPKSAKLAEKLGMRLEGTFKDGEFFKGEWCDMWLYAILKGENG